MADKKIDPENEGHRVEWQDRARVVVDPRKNLEKEASPRQSPLPDEEKEEKNRKSKPDSGDESPDGSQRDSAKPDAVY